MIKKVRGKIRLKKVFSLMVVFALVCSIFAGCTTNQNAVDTAPKDNSKKTVVVTHFAAYDFVRSIAKDSINLVFLMGPGVDAHSYQPKPSDIKTISKADLFIYVGWHMEGWVEDLTKAGQLKGIQTLKLMDTVSVIEEAEVDGAEEQEHDHKHDNTLGHKIKHFFQHLFKLEHDCEGDHDHDEVEYDEHIWASPANALIMLDSIEGALSALVPANKDMYMRNADTYKSAIAKVQSDIKDIVEGSVRKRLVFADKMPMQYFLNEFGLEASAAFSGCSTETDPSTATIANLVKTVKTERIPVILYIELNTGKVAKAIAQETGAKPMQIQTLHNLSKKDFEAGETYVSLMTRNLEVLKAALQ